MSSLPWIFLGGCVIFLIYLIFVLKDLVRWARQAILQNDFKKFYAQYDQRRNKDFCKTFPNLKEWYNNLWTLL